MSVVGPVPWPALIEALEERTRRLAAIVESGSAGLLPETPLRAPEGSLPVELELPVRVLLAETRRLEQLAERRKAAIERELRYRRP